MTDEDQPLRAIHALFCSLTKRDIPWHTGLRWPWQCFTQRFTVEDLKLVISFIQAQQRQHRPARSLIFRSLISGPASLQFFAEDLAEAKALSRRPKPTARDRILAATGRAPEITHTAQTPAQIMRASEALRNLLNLRDSL